MRTAASVDSLSRRGLDSGFTSGQEEICDMSSEQGREGKMNCKFMLVERDLRLICDCGCSRDFEALETWPSQ